MTTLAVRDTDILQWDVSVSPVSSSSPEAGSWLPFGEPFLPPTEGSCG